MVPGSRVLGELGRSASESRPLALAGQLEEGLGEIGAELLGLEDRDGAVGGLADDGDVDHPDQAVVEELRSAPARCRR